MADLGRVRPLYGAWRWPYRSMHEGDEFHVHYEDRAPEDVRQLASVRAAQLGIRVSCRRDDEAGVIRVTRVPFDTDSAKGLPKVLAYEQVKALLRNLYGLDADDVPWQAAIDPGEVLRSRADRTGDDPRRLVEVAVANQRYAVELLDDQVVATVLGGKETLESWKSAKLSAMME